MLNFTIIKLSLCVIAGILLGNYFGFPAAYLAPAGVVVAVIFISSYYRSRRLFLQDSLFGLASFLLFLFLGLTASSLNQPENNPQHYIHHTTNRTTDLLKAQVHERLKPGLYQDKYILKVKELNGNPVTGKLLLNISRGDSLPILEAGELIAIAARVIPINQPLNPYQFDYSNYMENLGVLRQTNLEWDQVRRLEGKITGIREVAGNIRAAITYRLREFSFGRDELAIIQALLLGQRQEISQEIYSNYAAAGVIHILAVSGLHVGIILLLLNRLLTPLERLPGGKIVKTLLLLILMWGFAVLAGLSPSVVRAVSMFSFVAIGMQLNRRTSVLNTLFISLLVLLLINPGYISQVGFQLSYAAVFSIVLIQPHLFSLYKGESRLIKYLWGILSVTIAAQIGVLPLSLFYFHQFPGLFFVSNLLILPFLGIILGTGILVLLLALLDLLPEFLAAAFGWMIQMLNLIVEAVAAKEQFIFQNISFSLLLCVVSYFVVAGFILLLKRISYRRVLFFLTSLILLQAAFIAERYSAERSEAVVFHKSRNTVMGHKKGRELLLFHDLQDAAGSYSFIRDYSVEKDIKTITELPVRDVFFLQENKILRVDSSGIYKIPGLKPDILLLTNSPRINLQRVIEEINPDLIIADGSNYPSIVRRWKKTAEREKLPFHATGERGAFIFPSAEND